MEYKRFKFFIDEIIKFNLDCAKAAKALSCITGEDTSVSLGDNFQDSYVKLLEEATGNTGWVEWYVWEGWFGKNAEGAAYASPDRTSPETVREIYKKIYPETKEIKLTRAVS